MSTATIATILLLGVFLGLVFFRVPVVYAIGVASLLDFFYLGINPMQMALKFVSNLNSYTLLAVPFFILMGELMSAGGITDTLIAFSKELVGWMRGGAAMVNVVASFFFGGISGSSSADCASLGPIEIKMMEEQGYDREFSTCLTMASSVEGILVPPLSEHGHLHSGCCRRHHRFHRPAVRGRLHARRCAEHRADDLLLLLLQEDEHPGHRQV